MPLTGPEQKDADDAKDIGLATRWLDEVEAPADKQGELQTMFDASAEKLDRIEPDVVAHNDPDFLAGLRFDLMHQDPPMSGAEADAEIVERTAFYNTKKARILNKRRLMDSEITLRLRGDLDRSGDLVKIAVPD